MTDRLTPDQMRRELDRLTERLRKLENNNNFLAGRRTAATGQPVSAHDYIRKFELDEAVRKIKRLTENLKAAPVEGAGTGTGGGPPPPPPPPGCQPNHPLDLGYWLVDGRYGDYYSAVKPYTNLFVAWAGDRQYVDDSTTPPDVMLARLKTALERAFADDWDIYLIAEMDSTYFHQDDLLDILASVPALPAGNIHPIWDSIKYVDAADEPDFTTGAELSDAITSFAAGAASRHLNPSSPLYGVTLSVDQILDPEDPGDPLYGAQGVGFVGIEMYTLPTDYHNDINEIFPYLKSLFDNYDAVIGPQKKLIPIMQGYDRNGAFPPGKIDQMVEIQDATYNVVKDVPRVAGITIFNYGRPGGTVTYTQLQDKHKQIASCIHSGQTTITEQAKDRARAASGSMAFNDG